MASSNAPQNVVLFCVSVAALSICCLVSMLYIQKVLALVVTLILRYLVLPKRVVFQIGAIQLSILHARILFRDVLYVDENMSLRIVDGYLTFNYWGYWLHNFSWTILHEYMLDEHVVGARCRVAINLGRHRKGTVVAVHKDKKKVMVQLDGRSWSGEDEEDEEDIGDADSRSRFADGESVSSNQPSQTDFIGRPFETEEDGAHGAALHRRGSWRARRQRMDTPFVSGPMLRSDDEQQSQQPPLARSPTPTAGARASSQQPSRGAGANSTTFPPTAESTLIKAFDPHRVSVRANPGRCRLHVNGMRACIYNTTGKYRDLANAAAENASNNTSGAGHSPSTSFGAGGAASTSARSKGSTAKNKNNNNNKGNQRSANSSSGGGHPPPTELDAVDDDGLDHEGMTTVSGAKPSLLRSFFTQQAAKLFNLESSYGCDAEVEAARKLQAAQLKSRSLSQRFYDFVAAVEVELYAIAIDIGSVEGTFPYFLHLTAHRSEGRLCHTNEGCPSIDLYRFVAELTMQGVDLRMAHIHDTNQSPSFFAQTLLQRAALLVRGTSGNDDSHVGINNNGGPPPANDASPSSPTASTPDLLKSDLLSKYGIILDGTDKGSVHVVFYRDAPNVYAGETVVRGSLPTMGIELLLDSPRIRYGPWLEYSRTKFWDFFFPPNYRPLEPLHFEVGQPRPFAGFEFFAEFLRDTSLEIAFKRRYAAPNPPFGLINMRPDGLLVATLGGGTQYIQPAFFLLRGEEKQVYQGLLSAPHITVKSNGVLNATSTLCTLDSLQCFIDREDDRLWNGRRRFNVLPKISSGEVFFHMSYVDYFMALLDDWQYAENSYLGVPLTTERFNTLERAVTTFVPNVKRFEVFVDGILRVHVSVNDNNVIYSEDPNDVQHNIFAVVTATGFSFSMVLPSDVYQLSCDNEIARPLQGSAGDLKAYLSLPPSHPLHEYISSDVPWATCGKLRFKGLFTGMTANQAIPQLLDRMKGTTGRTLQSNFFELELDFHQLRGNLLGVHVKALLNCFDNVFLDNTLPIRPDELFWLLAKIQSSATTGKNKRKEYTQFLQSKSSQPNDMELSVLVRITDMEVNAQAVRGVGQRGIHAPPPPTVNLSAGVFTFTYVKQFSVADTQVTLSPIALRFLEASDATTSTTKGGGGGGGGANTTRAICADRYLCVGYINVSLVKHFGRMPYRPKVHESFSIHINGLSFDMDLPQLIVLSQVLQSFAETFKMEDAQLVSEVAEARAEAEYAAERLLLKRSTRRGKTGGLSERVPTFRIAATSTTEEMEVGHMNSTAADMTSPTFVINNTANNNLLLRQESPTTTAAISAEVGHNIIASDDGNPSDRSAFLLGASRSIFDASPTSTRSGVHALRNIAANALNTSVVTSHATVEIDPLLDFAYDDDADFGDTVPRDLAEEFAEFMEMVNVAEDTAKDYGLFFTSVSVRRVGGLVHIPDTGVFSVEAPQGLRLGHSTFNDGNSNKRMSAMAKQISIRGLVKDDGRSSGSSPKLSGTINMTNLGLGRSEMVEVLHFRTSVALRHYIAYSLNGSIEAHREKQKAFLVEHDYESLLDASLFDPTSEDITKANNTPAPAAGAATSSPPPSRAAAKQQSSPATPSPSPARPPQHVGATPGAALDNNLDLSSSTGGNDDDDSSGGPPISRRLRLATHGQHHDGTESSTRAATDVESTFLDLIHARGMEASSSWIEPPEEQPSQPFANHQTHDTTATNTSALFSTCGDELHDEDVTGGGGTSSHRFATCISATSYTLASDAEEGGLHGAGGSSSSSNDGGEEDGAMRRTHNLNKTTNSATATAGGVDLNSSYDLQEEIPLTSFVRGYIRDPNNDGEPTVLQYCAARTTTSTSYPSSATSTRPTQRRRAYYHASIPYPAFLEVGDSSNCPSFSAVPTMMMMDEGSAATTDGFAAVDDLLWSRKRADNRERCRNKTTSKHYHVEATDPVQLLVTKSAIFLAATAIRVVTEIHYAEDEARRAASRLKGDALRTPHTPASSYAASRRKKRGKTLFAEHLPTGRQLHSRSRVLQKKWLWEDHLYSFEVPLIEIKLLSQLPIPVTNAVDPQHPGDGIYCSTVVLRAIKLNARRSEPPEGEATSISSVASRKLSISLKLLSVGLYTQVEYEPIRRRGNLNVSIPFIGYDQSKDTIAVAYLLHCHGQAKRDLVRGVEGGGSKVFVQAIEAHGCRDFIDYVVAMVALVREVDEGVRQRLRVLTSLAPLTKRGAGAAHEGELSAASDVMAMREVSEVSEAHPPPRRRGLSVRVMEPRKTTSTTSTSPAQPETPPQKRSTFIFTRWQTLQCRCSVERILIRLVDATKSGRVVHVDLNSASTLEVLRPSLNVEVIMPRRHQDTTIQVNGVAAIQALRVKLYPTLLSILQPRSTQPLGHPLRGGFMEPPTTNVFGEESSFSAAAGTSGMHQNISSPHLHKSSSSSMSGLRLCLNGTFSLAEIDVSVMHSELNFVHLNGTKFRGSASTRAEAISSRECVQTEALTENISNGIRRQLRVLAERARLRAKRSNFAAPPFTTSQLQLCSSYALFMEKMECEYVADAILPLGNSESHLAMMGDESPPTWNRKNSVVFHALVDDLSALVESTNQYDVVGEQININVLVHQLQLSSPYRPQAAQTVHPQVHLFLNAWIAAAESAMRRIDEVRRTAMPATDNVNINAVPITAMSSRIMNPTNRAVTLSLQAHNLEAIMGLPQKIRQTIVFPQLSLFLQSSSGDRVAMKIHLHPFNVSSTAESSYVVGLPHVYITFAQDDIKTTCTVMIEVLNITLHPLFVNHALLAYGKVVDELVPMFSKRVRITTPSNNNTPTTTTANNNNKMITPTARRRRLFFIVRGMRLSYVTSMTNLRFSMRHLNAKAESEAQSANEHRLGWVVHVTSAQLALVDREDHDQSRRLQASHVEQRRASQSKTNSVDSTPLLANTTTSAGTRRGDANDARSTNSATGGQSPLGGFIWGSAELSCTLTGGRTDRNLARETLLANDVFRAYSTDLQTELLNQLSHSSYRWELTVLSPLIILRCGLDAMLRQCSDETVHDIQRLKQAMLYQDRIFKQRLTQHSEFTRLQREKSRNDQLYRRAAEEHLIRLRAMTEEVVRQVEQTPQNNQRRASLAPTTDASSVGMNVPSTSAIPPAEDEVRQLLRDCFCIKTEHKFSGTISTVCVVIPFGDAAFKSLVEELPSAFGCGKQERHVHSQMCLRRRSFVPMLALKLGVEEVSLFCGVEQSRWESSAAAARMPTASASASAAAAVFTAATSRHPRTSTTTTTTTTTANNTKRGILKQPPPPPPEFTESLTFCGRFSASGTKLYFTDGTELSEYLALRDVLDATTILGGLGELTSRDFHAELHRSRNTLNISSIDFPMRITRQDGHTRVCAVLDLSEPQMQMSSHIISILNELVKESSTLTLRCDASDGTTTRQSHDTSHSSRTMEVDEMGMSVATNTQNNNTSINNISTSSIQPPPKTTPPSSLSVDVAARLDAGVLQVYSYTAKDGAPSPNATSTRGSPRLNSKSPRRRVGFGAASGVYEHRHEEEAMAMMMDRDKPTLDHSMERMHCVFTMPLPAVSVQGVAAYGNRNKEQDEVDVHVEVRAGSIELGPSITTLAKEIEACACIYNIHQQKRSERIVSLAEEMEDQVPELLMPLHCNLMDLLVPVPRAMAAVLSKSRMHSVKKLRRPDTSTTSPNHASTTSPHKNKSSSTSKQNLDALVQRKITHPSLTAIHVSLNDLKVTFSCEPVASTSVMVFLEDNGGVDVLITLRQQPSSLSSASSPSSSSSTTTTTTALQPYVEVLPEFVLVCTARRLRAECQTRLEVKSLEIALPEAQAIVSQRGGRGGEVTSITVNLPLMMEGSRPNIIILAQHTAQVFSVVELWQKTVLSTLRSVRNIFDDGTPGAMVAEHMANTPLARTIRSKAQHALAARRRQADRRWMCTACLTSGLCHADLGGGSLQQLAFGALRFSVEKWSRSMSCTTYVVSSYINNLHTRSEGALSGMLHVATAGMQMFLIENVAGGEVFVRSKSNRTMRAAVVVENAHANFKERQVKDVFECRVGDFRLHVMDGMSEEGYTTVELDGVLAKGKLGVTPSTVPTFLTFVRTVSSIISEQRASARGKLLRSAFFLERVDGGDGSPLEGHAHPLQDHRTSASQVRRSASLATYSPNTHKSSTSPSSVSTPPLSSPLPPSHSPLPKDDARAPSTTSPPTAVPVIPFLGRAYTRVPCGQVRVSLEETSLLLGAMSSGEAATGCVVVHLPRARLSYAETACEDYKSIKKVLRMETHNVEISRPGPTKVVILGFKSSNHFEFFTQQQLGSSQVGFVMTLTQRHPWTGNPRFRDFEEIINLVHSFTDKANADVFQHFGRVPMGGGDGTSMAEEGSMFQHSDRERSRKESGSHQASGSSAAVGFNAHSPAGSVDDAMGGGGGLHAATSAIVTPVDARTLKALRGSAFSPQLRFGGDVSVNTDVILNWLGITESMLPYVLHTKVCDAMEAALDTLASNISERVRQDSPSSSSSSSLL